MRRALLDYISGGGGLRLERTGDAFIATLHDAPLLEAILQEIRGRGAN